MAVQLFWGLQTTPTDRHPSPKSHPKTGPQHLAICLVGLLPLKSDLKPQNPTWNFKTPLCRSDFRLNGARSELIAQKLAFGTEVISRVSTVSDYAFEVEWDNMRATSRERAQSDY
jgi:hypothetical protein